MAVTCFCALPLYTISNTDKYTPTHTNNTLAHAYYLHISLQFEVAPVAALPPSFMKRVSHVKVSPAVVSGRRRDASERREHRLDLLPLPPSPPPFIIYVRLPPSLLFTLCFLPSSSPISLPVFPYPSPSSLLFTHFTPSLLFTPAPLLILPFPSVYSSSPSLFLNSPPFTPSLSFPSPPLLSPPQDRHDEASSILPPLTYLRSAFLFLLIEIFIPPRARYLPPVPSSPSPTPAPLRVPYFSPFISCMTYISPPLHSLPSPYSTNRPLPLLHELPPPHKGAMLFLFLKCESIFRT